MAKNAKLSVSLIGAVIACLALIVGSHVLMGNASNMIKDENDNTPKKKEEPTKLIEVEETIKSIVLRIGDEQFVAYIDNSAPAQEFAKTVPFELDMKELNGNEKYYTGKDKFENTEEYKPGQIKAGDLMLYGDDTIVLFYKSFNSDYSYTRLGWVQDTSRLAQELGDGDVTVIFTKQ